MKASEIFQRLSPATAEHVLSYLQETEKPTYKAAIQTLAAQRKLRPVFVERKPRAERHVWLQSALGRAQGEQIAANLLQMGLMGRPPLAEKLAADERLHLPANAAAPVAPAVATAAPTANG